VLFSKPELANYVNGNFEPVWESVRPVPMVKIDFGNGTVLTRTLHGNIASYVCAADGQVLDIIPGIYAPAAYLERLSQLRLLANYVDQQGKTKRAERLKAYHEGQQQALAKKRVPPVLFNMADRSKAVIEGGIKAVLVPCGRAPVRAARSQVAVASTDQPKLATKEDLADWKLLVKDTQQNETERRRQIHEMLAAAGAVKPTAVTKKLYKEVLHADLDDPYLGLGPVLFANYAFAKEDKTH
jgi:hypothetical protein